MPIKGPMYQYTWIFVGEKDCVLEAWYGIQSKWESEMADRATDNAHKNAYIEIRCAIRE